jgi:periplasmic protein TonB
MAASYWNREASYRKRISILLPFVAALVVIAFLVSGRAKHGQITRLVGLRGPVEVLPEITIEPDDPSPQASPSPAGQNATPTVALDLRNDGDVDAPLPLPEPNPPRPIPETFPEHDDVASHEVVGRREVPYSDRYVILHMVKPKYPPRELEDGVEGNVTVEIFVDERGHVAQANVLSGIGPDSFQTSALEAVRQFLFRPPTENGRPSTMWVKFLIKFRIVA